MAEQKTYTIRKHRRNGVSETTGTLAELTQNFSYTLSSGRSYDSKVAIAPRTAKSLVTNLNRAVDSLQRGSYNPDYYQLIGE
jgi:hypothetical protein